MQCIRLDYSPYENIDCIVLMTRRVQCNKEYYDVYIGRGRCPRTGTVSIWGNPFSFEKHSAAPYLVGSREESLTKHKDWLKTQPDLLSRLCQLKNKTLGCWCESHERCHGDNIIELISELCN